MKSHRFTLIEVVFATVLLGGLIAAVISTQRGLMRMEAAFVQEQRAVIAMGNVVTQLQQRTTVSQPELQALLAAELAGGDARLIGLQPACSLAQNELVLAFIKANGKPLVRVRIPQ